MGKVIHTSWVCDLCGKKFDQEKYPSGLERTEVPGLITTSSDSYVIGGITLDLCEECKNEFFSVVFKNFARIDKRKESLYVEKVYKYFNSVEE